eukprot:7291851-Alexandrium_andersonii.AAC.1
MPPRVVSAARMFGAGFDVHRPFKIVIRRAPAMFAGIAVKAQPFRALDGAPTARWRAEVHTRAGRCFDRAGVGLASALQESQMG